MANQNIFMVLLLLLGLSSCGPSRHSQESGYESISWIISFKTNVSEDRKQKTIADMTASIQGYVQRQDPQARVDVHTSPGAEGSIQLDAILMGATTPRSPSGGPHLPPRKNYIHLPDLQNITLNKAGNSIRAKE